MNKNELIAILNDWNFWRRELETGVPRHQYLASVKRFLDTNQVLTITGPRRAGKSFLMRQAAWALTKDGVRTENILIANFEDPRFPELTIKLLEQLYETYLEFLTPKGPVYLFLDEVQEIDGWERWVRYMHELKKAKLVVSGSNAKLLSRELGTLLTGRHLDVTVFPLSFTEFLAFNGVAVNDRLDLLNKRVEIQGLLRKYLEFGAFPEVSLSQQKQAILLSYFEDLVTKDLLRRFKVRKPQELKALIKHYLSHVATLTTFHSLAKFLKLSPGTVEKFSSYLEQVYLVFFVKRFSFKVREQEKNPRKVYAIDTGLSNTVGFRFSENIGRLAENVVFLHLKRQQVLHPDAELYYWKDLHHREVDFVIKEGTKVKQLIQVCWHVEDARTKDRELRSLVKAMEELKVSRSLVITEEHEAEEQFKGRRIAFTPLWKWLLG
ncbi:MAG: ATP-binding protein [Candidatus Omnitrophica bacterium]|nr:ATP-binding protein [Candidatus Omnitrophota bacterium]